MFFVLMFNILLVILLINNNKNIKMQQLIL